MSDILKDCDRCGEPLTINTSRTGAITGAVCDTCGAFYNTTENHQAEIARRRAGKPRLTLGTIAATPGAMEPVEQAGDNAAGFLARHSRGDWGDVEQGDFYSNDAALDNGERILSVYTLSDGSKLWIITEWDRSATTLLLPSEY